MKTTATLFEIEDPVATRAWQRVAPVVVEATEDDVTGVAGIALVGELLDHLGLVEAADRRGLRPIGPGGYTELVQDPWTLHYLETRMETWQTRARSSRPRSGIPLS